MSFEQRPEGGESAGRVSSMCKGPEARVCLESHRNSNKQWIKQSGLERVVGEEITKVMTIRCVEPQISPCQLYALKITSSSLWLVFQLV